MHDGGLNPILGKRAVMDRPQGRADGLPPRQGIAAQRPAVAILRLPRGSPQGVCGSVRWYYSVSFINAEVWACRTVGWSV